MRRPVFAVLVAVSIGVPALAMIPPGSRPPDPPLGSAAAPRRGPAGRAPAPGAIAFVTAQLPENAPVTVAAGTAWIGANDLARLLEATKFWRADVRKLELRSHGHRILLTVDAPFVVVDDRTVRLDYAVRSSAGELQIPVAIADSLPRDPPLPRLVFDPGRGRVLQVPSAGVIRVPRIEERDGETRVSFPADQLEDVVIASRSRAHFKLRFPGFFVGSMPDSLGGGVVRRLRVIPAAAGSAFELEIGPEAQGFQIVADPRDGAVELRIATRAAAGLDRFAPEGPPGPRPLRVVVIDPGHGGADGGVQSNGLVEKDLTLALAKLLKSEIERRLGAQVVLTRDDDRSLTMEERAERANRARADLVISLHFDGFPGPAHRGATAFCTPAVYAGGEDEGRGAAIDVLPWRDVASRHAVRSRELTEAILAALDLRGQGPARLRETLPLPLLGVNAPGLMLECATLTSPADRERITSAQGLPQLAASLAAGIEAYRWSR